MGEAMFSYGFWSCIPIIVLIAGLLITKRMVETMVVAVSVGAIMCYKTGAFMGSIQLCMDTIANPNYMGLMIMLVGFGAMIKLFEVSGALHGFSGVVRKFAKTRRSAMVTTWLLSMVIFVDDYLDILATSSAMKQTTDDLNVPREHLAYGINSMGVCVGIMIPFSTWSAFAISCSSEFGITWGTYVQSLHYMYFPIIALVVCLLVAVGIIPRVGALKKAYERVDAGGPVHVKEETGASIVAVGSEENEEEIKVSSPINFIIPVIVLVIVMMIFDKNIVPGILAGIITQFVLYVPQKLTTVTDFVNNLLEGVNSMIPLSICILLGNMVSTLSNNMGFQNFITGVLSAAVPAKLMPCVVFVAMAAITWAACNFWVLILLTVPIFLPTAIQMGINPGLILAAIVSGAGFGSKFCPYSDCVFICSAGTGVSNMTQLKVAAPYVLGSAVLAAICFLVTGFVVC